MADFMPAGVVPEARPLDDYADVIGRPQLAEIRNLARYVEGRTFQHVNSTAVGGGVAEILARLVPMMRDLGVDARWSVMEGDAEFFKATKAFHNALHGMLVPLDDSMFDAYERATERNRGLLQDCDYVALHDPQPAGLIEYRRDVRSKFVWRCHIDVSEAEARLWAFLRRRIERFDASIFHLPQYTKGLHIPQVLLPPAIDPLSEKNCDLPDHEVKSIVASHGIDPEKPMVLQVSRFDWLKDPLGVVEAFGIVRRWMECQLVLAGGSASDDPEGAEVLAAVLRRAEGVPDVHILSLPPDAHRTINALQRAATVIVQKSVREGFGLVVTEGMWKGKPVVGGSVGGIRYQLVHDVTGFLVHSPEGCAFRVRQLLADPERARIMGQRAQESVRERYLLPSYIRNWILVLLAMDRGPVPVNHL
ncbi:glycosyltransferase [Myxococcota bacterium]|nr:glycosyltransferase [Myxococcota bacterium]